MIPLNTSLASEVLGAVLIRGQRLKEGDVHLKTKVIIHDKIMLRFLIRTIFGLWRLLQGDA